MDVTACMGQYTNSMSTLSTFKYCKNIQVLQLSNPLQQRNLKSL